MVRANEAHGPTTSRGPTEERVYVGVGGNVGDVRAAIAAAERAVGGLPGVVVVGRSSLYETAPVGPVTDQPPFLNACFALRCTGTPRELLEGLLEVERALGRDRTRETPGGPRRMDLDLLLWGTSIVEEPGLSVPHPRLWNRAFVLVPLVELAGPDLLVPGHGRAGDLLVAVRDQAVKKVV